MRRVDKRAWRQYCAGCAHARNHPPALDIGMLREFTGRRRGRVYSYVKYLEILKRDRSASLNAYAPSGNNGSS